MIPENGKLVFVIEDEKNILELIAHHLEQGGYRVRKVMDGEKAIDGILYYKPDLILLDLMLPGIGGLEICKILKQNYRTYDIPIIMITAKSEDSDVVLGLELGADDYVTKPFSPKQLMARVKAVLRRAAPGEPKKILRAGALEMDIEKHAVCLHDKNLALTSKEYLILKLFLECSGRVLSREYILDKVWGDDESLDVEVRAIDKYVGELRRKLKAEASRIITVKNFGYRFKVSEE